MYGILFFDGTFSNYPLRYGFDIDENFSLFYNGYFPNQEAEFDTNFVDTHLLYTQGDYYLDRLFIKTTYADKSRLLIFNGYKKTFAEMSKIYKYKIDHRSKAFNKIKRFF